MRDSFADAWWWAEIGMVAHKKMQVPPGRAESGLQALQADGLVQLLSALSASSAARLPTCDASVADAADVTGSVQHVAQELLGSHISSDAPLMEAGLDSLGAVEFRSRLSSHLGDIKLPETLIFDFPTLRQVEAHVCDVLNACSTQAGAGGKAMIRGAALQQLLQQLSTTPRQEHAPLAPLTAASASAPIVHAATCRLGGGVDSPTSLWGASTAAQDAVATVPERRWDVRVEGRVAYGAFMRVLELFDHTAFSIAPAEAEIMDPHQKLALEGGYSCLHQAGFNRGTLMGSVTGVFAGIWTSDYSAVLPKRGAASSGSFAMNLTGISMLVGRLSYTLGLQGPCIPYDTACSSSLCASHAALCALQRQETEPALVMGVNVMCDSGTSQMFAASGMTSQTGKSYTFDSRADGYARGEACCGAVLELERLTTRGVRFLAGAVRQDGRSASLTAPNGVAQQALLRAVLGVASRSTKGAFLLEAHGTGTSLGDPIEARAMVAVRYEPQLMAVMGCKANVGHTEPAAGSTSILKLSQAMLHGTAAPNAQLRASNPHVTSAMRDGQLSSLPVQPGPPPRGVEEVVGGVSSFGLNGTIAHLVFVSAGNPFIAGMASECRKSLAFGARGAEMASGGVTTPPCNFEECSLLERCPSRLHFYRRSHFPWWITDVSSRLPSSSHALTSPALAPQTASVRILDADTPLMEAGVRSHQAVRFAARLQELTSVANPATLIFEHPTPRAIVSHFLDSESKTVIDIDTAIALANEFTAANATSSDAPFRAEVDSTYGISANAALPASSFQQHFLLLHLLQQHSAAYSLPMTLEWPSHLPQPLARSALQHIARRHAVLRSFYEMNQMGAIQIILPSDGFVFPLDEYNDFDWWERMAQMLRTPFALAQAPPVRALLMRSQVQQRTGLLVVADHVATDYASTLIMKKELRLLCSAMVMNVSPLLPALQLQYADFAIWQQRHRVDGEATLDWWRIRLAGSPPLLELPWDRPRVPMSAASGSFMKLHLAPELGKAMQLLCARKQVSILTCFLAAWSALLMFLSGQEEIVLGLPFSVQMEHIELQDVVGCFATPIPLRLAMAVSFDQHLPKAYAGLLQAIEHIDVPLYQIVKASGHERSNLFNPMFQTIVQLLPSAEVEEAHVSTSDGNIRTDGSQLQGMDLFLNFIQEDDASFDGKLLFNAAMFDHVRVESVLAHLTSLLSDVLAAPNAAYHDVMAHINCTETAMLRNLPRRAERMVHGCEVLSTFEIEEALLRSHAPMLDVAAFSAPHREHGNVVGIVTMAYSGYTVSLCEQCKGAAVLLPAQWLPQAVVEADALPAHLSAAAAHHDLADRFVGLQDDHEDKSREPMAAGMPAASPTNLDHAVSSHKWPHFEELLDTVYDAVQMYTSDELVLDADVPLMNAGVNSMAAINIASRLRSQTSLDLPVTLIFEQQTPRAICAHLSGLKDARLGLTPSTTVASAEGGLTNQATPVSDYRSGGSTSAGASDEEEWQRAHAEMALEEAGALPSWSSMLRDYQVTAFHITQLYELQEDDDLQLVSCSLWALTACHLMLLAVHMPPFFFVDRHHSCQELDVANVSAGLQGTLWRDVVQPFGGLLPIDLSAAPLRARVLYIHGQAPCLVLSLHHAILDGPSQQIVRTHLITILEAQRRAQPADLPTYDASDTARHAIMRYLRAQSARLHVELASASGLWKVRLPFAKAGGQDLKVSSVASIWHIAQETITREQAFAASIGVTLNALFLAKLALMIHKVSMQQQFTISQTYLGRRMDEMLAVGSYSVGVPLEFNFSDKPDLRAVCHHVHRETQRMLAIDALVQSAQPVMVAYELNEARPLHRPPETRQLPSSFAVADLFFTINQYSDGFTAMVLYDQGKYDAMGIDACVAQWIGVEQL